MIVLIDNYDSFSYNLYQLIGAMRPDLTVLRNDAVTVEELESMAPEAVFLSPGPGRPADAGICEEVVRRLTGQVPLFGVCLGHQAICEALGGTVSYARELVHGKQSQLALLPSCPLFQDLPPVIPAARYHSLAAVEETLPACLQVVARSEDREVMVVAHRDYPVYGLQFHPESVMTPGGAVIVRNFLRTIGAL